MTRPTNKDDLLSLAQVNFDKLLDFIASIPENCRETGYSLNGRDRTIRDVLCHLHEWHCMMERWYLEGLEGKTPIIPGEGYTWRTLPALNHEIWKRCQDTSFADSLSSLKKSHKNMLKLISGIPNEDLFSKNVYKWTKTTTLGAYFVSATSSHYDWALKTLRPIRKMIG
jgi:hypothetical protein